MTDAQTPTLILASSSPIRLKLLRSAGLTVDAVPARIDEVAIRNAMRLDGAGARDVADALAEMKAQKIAAKVPGRLVLGCDQVLEHDGVIIGKPQDRSEAHAQLLALRGGRHSLLSAAVVYLDAAPLWRHLGIARLTMRDFSDSYLDAYLARNWQSVQGSVGGYKLEEEGVRLFSRIEGDYFTILGLPLLPLLAWLILRGDIEG